MGPAELLWAGACLIVVMARVTNTLYLQVQTPMHIVRTMQWAHKPTRVTRPRHIYYEVFHCNTKSYVVVLHKPLVDAYICLGLSDSLSEDSEELGRMHN